MLTVINVIVFFHLDDVAACEVIFVDSDIIYVYQVEFLLVNEQFSGSLLNLTSLPYITLSGVVNETVGHIYLYFHNVYVCYKQACTLYPSTTIYLSEHVFKHEPCMMKFGPNVTS